MFLRILLTQNLNTCTGMSKNSIESVFTQEVHNKYLVFNTLFSRLPYDKMAKIGQLMPFLHDLSEAGFEQGKEPKEIINLFFSQYTSIKDEKEKIDLLFRFITYIERQVVLFDSIEDSAFEKLTPLNGKGTLQSTLDLAVQQNKLEEVKEKLILTESLHLLVAEQLVFSV